MSQVSIIGPTATNVIVKLDRVNALSTEYRFSNEFTFSNMIWKVACKEIRSNLSFLIYSTNKTLHRNRGFKILVKIPARSEGQDMFVEARRQFGNKSTCFTWTCDRHAIHSNCVIMDTLVIDVAIQIMADDRILSRVSHPALTAADSSFDEAIPMGRPLVSLTGSQTEVFDWIAVGLDTIGQEGRYSDEYLFAGQVWETSICRSGLIFALKINCNREKRGRGLNGWSVCARVQIVLKALVTNPPDADESVGNEKLFHKIEVEGARCFTTPDDSMCWSFDKNVNSLIIDNSLVIQTRIVVYSYQNDSQSAAMAAPTAAPAAAPSAQNGYAGHNGVTVKGDVDMPDADPVDGLQHPVLANGSPFSADMTFVTANEKKTHVHRGVLMASSPYFREYIKTTDSHVCEIRLPDMKESEILSLVRYMYTDEIKVDDDDLYRTIKAAEKFLMMDFVNRCKPVITPDNVFKFLDPKKSNTIVNECWAIVDNRFEEVSQQASFHQVPLATLQAILSRDTLRVKELKVYTAVVMWAIGQCVAKGLEPTKDRQKEELRDVLPLIRFPVMTSADFSTSPVNDQLLEPNDVIQCYMYQTTQAVAPGLKFSTTKRIGS